VSGAATAGTLTRLAMLLHDCAKPQTRAEDEAGNLSFYGHQDAGAELALPALQRLKLSGDELERVLLMVREHLRLGYYSDQAPVPPKLVYRYIRRVGAATPLMLLHSIADCMATQGDWTARALVEHVHAAADILRHYYAADSVAAPPLLLDGNAIMQVLGIKPGKAVGLLKDALLEATAAGEVQTVEEAEAFVRKMYAELG
jgi:UTP:GlnB (protein PII) uridylyltransferase